jgi:hypothetical protein
VISGRRVACAALLATSVACGSSGSGSTDAGTAADAATADSGSVPADGGGPSEGGGACTGPANTASAVTATCDPGAAHSGSGNTIADGTYQVSSVVVASGSPCSSIWAPGATLQIAGGGFAITFAPAPGLGEEHQHWSYSTSGSTLTMTLQCDTDPNGVIGAIDRPAYTATATQLTLLYPGDSAAGFPAQNVTFSRQ